jgi:serine O-acetyltransferase
VVFAHQGLIVVNDAARIGNDCLIRHGVTLGARDDLRSSEAPVLEDEVEIGVNAVIIGPVVIGAGTKVGPCALVIHDVPAGSRVLAPLADVRCPGAPF